MVSRYVDKIPKGIAGTVAKILEMKDEKTMQEQRNFKDLPRKSANFVGKRGCFMVFLGISEGISG